jgi:hypothetical protein
MVQRLRPAFNPTPDFVRTLQNQILARYSSNEAVIGLNSFTTRVAAAPFSRAPSRDEDPVA